MSDAEFAIGACPEQNFEGVTSDKWACVKNVVNTQYHININDDEGRITKDGFTITWSYNPGAQKLRVQCTASPLFVPCPAINKEIHKIAQDCGF